MAGMLTVVGRRWSKWLPCTIATSTSCPFGAGIGVSDGSNTMASDTPASTAEAAGLVRSRSSASSRNAFTSTTTDDTAHTPVIDASGSRKPLPTCE